MSIRKEALIMTDVLTANLDSIIETKVQKTDKEEIHENKIIRYLEYRKLIKSDYAQDLIKKYIQKDKKNKHCQYIIKGTRITVEDIIRILAIKENAELEDIKKEYPSLENIEQVIAAILLYADKKLRLWKIIFDK